MAPRIKPVEGIVVVVDVGPHVRASTSETFYSCATKCLQNILQRKIFAEKCRDMVGIVLMGTDGTDNRMASDGRYQHITVLQAPKIVDWEMVSLASSLPFGSAGGDWLDALAVAMSLLKESGPTTIYSSKKIVLMTDFSSEFSDDLADVVLKELQREEIELNIIGPSLQEDCDDAAQNSGDYPGPSDTLSTNGGHSQDLNWNGKPKNRTQIAAETLVKRMLTEVDGIACSFDEALVQLVFFEKKSQSSAFWNAMLDIGPSFQMPVTGRIKVKQALIPTWKKSYVSDDNAAVMPESSFHKFDEEWTKVEGNEVISGYKYGTTLVPFGEENEQLKYTCDAQEAVLSVLGFSKREHVKLQLQAGDQVMYITAKAGDEDGAVALSSIIRALKEIDAVAVARKVYRKGSNPVLGALYPEITPEYECLVWVGLPFQEDYRTFCFPSIDGMLNALTKEQKDAMDSYIDAMDLSDDTENDFFYPPTTLNPELQHYFNCLTNRAIHPDDPLPSAIQQVQKILDPPPHLIEGRDQAAEKIKHLLPTTKIVKEKPHVNLATVPGDAIASTSAKEIVSGDLSSIVVTKIGSVTPAKDFDSLLRADPSKCASVFKDMSFVLLQLIESLTGVASLDNVIIPRIIEGIKPFRIESILIEPGEFNDFMEKCKAIVQAKTLKQLWQSIKGDKIGLIPYTETLKSKISSETADDFLTLDFAEEEEPKTEDEPQVDYDDMLDEM